MSKTNDGTAEAKMRENTQQQHEVRIRSFTDARKTVYVWIVKEDGPSNRGLMFGEMSPEDADALVKATGLEATRETVDMQRNLVPVHRVPEPTLQLEAALFPATPEGGK